MRTSEMIRIAAFSFLGWILIFWGQPGIYRSGFFSWFALNVRSRDAWISNYYIPGACIVFVSTVLSTLVWYFVAAKAKPRGATNMAGWQLIWWLILLFPILSICFALYLYNYNAQALGSLTTLFMIDVLFLYWFTTAISSPRALSNIPPGAFLLRRLFRVRD